MNGLRVAGLSAGYTHVPILRGVDMSVEPGEVVGILGANGAGKTTLLRTLMGSLRAKTGTISLGDTDISRLPPDRRARAGLAHVPEGRRLFVSLTVEEHLDLAGLINPDARQAKRRVFDLLPKLAERRRQQAGTLSGGEQQMVAIGRAMMTGPRFLLIDELSAGLAPILAQDLVEGLVRNRGAMGVLLVEQNPHLLAEAVDRVYLIQHGTLVAEGTFASLGGADRIADLYLGVQHHDR